MLQFKFCAFDFEIVDFFQNDCNIIAKYFLNKDLNYLHKFRRKLKQNYKFRFISYDNITNNLNLNFQKTIS